MVFRRLADGMSMERRESQAQRSNMEQQELEIPYERDPTDPRLRRGLGGRLRGVRGHQAPWSRERERIRSAITRGVLNVNAWGRWTARHGRQTATGWTFTEQGGAERQAEIEAVLARRESPEARIRLVPPDEGTRERLAIELDTRPPDLAIIIQDWARPKTNDDAAATLIKNLRTRGSVVHMVCTLGDSRTIGGRLHAQAIQERRRRGDPLAGPLPRSSDVEKKLGQALRARGHAPVAQQRVGPFFLDWALTKGTGKTQTRLDIEVDGRVWHESLPGTRSARDHQRDRIVSLLGWQPIRIWAEDIDQRIEVVVKRIEDALRPPRNEGEEA